MKERKPVKISLKHIAAARKSTPKVEVDPTDLSIPKRSAKDLRRLRLLGNVADLDALDKHWDQTDMEFTPCGNVKYKDVNSFDIQPWDPLQFPDHEEQGGLSIVLYGRRRTGKTFFTKWYWFIRNGDWDEVYVFAGAPGFYDKVIPKVFVKNKWDPILVRRIIEHAEWVHKTTGKKARIYIHLDDFAANTAVTRSKELADLYVRGRHAGITVSYCVQKTTAVPPIVRINTDLAIILTQLAMGEFKLLVETYLSRLNSRTGMELINKFTEMNHAVVIEVWRKVNFPLERYLFTAKASDVPDFPMKLSKEYLMMARQEEQDQAEDEKQVTVRDILDRAAGAKETDNEVTDLAMVLGSLQC